DIAKLAEAQGWVPPSPTLNGVMSDRAIVIADEGVFGAAKLLDSGTRLPTAVLVWAEADHNVPDPVVNALEASGFRAQLPVRRVGTAVTMGTGAQVQPTLVEVTGSHSDFEYQFPASPAYFVGRKA